MSSFPGDLSLSSGGSDALVGLDRYPFICDPVYFRQGLSNSPKMYTRSVIAEKLRNLQETTLLDYRFKIWDAWRPRHVQLKIYERFRKKLKAENPQLSDDEIRKKIKPYVAAPDNSILPPHSTGRAIDLTLCYRETGLELDMGTAFDQFGIEAKADYFEAVQRNVTVRDNRRILLRAMQSQGFVGDIEEWWHFEYGSFQWQEITELKEPRVTEDSA